MGFSFLRLTFRRRRRGRYVAHVAMRLRRFRCDYVARMLLVGGARACLRWVWFFVGLVLLGVAFLALSVLLLCSSLSLSPVLSASASRKTANLTAPIWGGHLVLHYFC